MNRRQLLKLFATTPLLSLAYNTSHAINSTVLTKKIPSTGEAIPVIGMGTWITFNVGDDTQARNQRTEVLKTFFDLGGTMVDSSPMYGSAEAVMGYALDRLGRPQDSLFSTTKVWTRRDGKAQIDESFRLWGLDKFDLFQVHNLLNWEEHLPYLLELKKRGVIRYVGITTSHGRRHAELEQLINEQPLDFVQLTYNVLDRDVEQRLLPAAQRNGVAVIVNRPFQGGRLFDIVEGKPLPPSAADIGCENWAQYFLKFVVSHPAVTCAIPATSQIAHLQQNMGSMHGELPTANQRDTMLNEIRSI
ncbi:aldo/keto reductase [Leucothrix pacifica]|uniref:Aldo/keto reductase n=1 Tax=Leucothrix pacifica TaxID=1247513 RepID=A0A317C183_9GAMM|nr:aldo/keto reductase [Leucothrix pacifica]PWQ92129.1 aldo/keto reductase [Leucothrix pacifica]